MKKSRKAFIEEMVVDMARILKEGVFRFNTVGDAEFARACLMELAERNIQDGRPRSL